MVAKVAYASLEERRELGVSARDKADLSSHSKWSPSADRPDPVQLLQEQNSAREPDLVPVRHGRMMASPFTFYRGGARIMAADLAATARAGLVVQLCGDAHLSNFGLFGSPERRLVFDINDFDETLPGPFEFDVKRMAASFTVAGRNNGFAKADIAAATLASVSAYREAMLMFAGMSTMDVWYAHLDEDEIRLVAREAAESLDKGRTKRTKSKSPGSGKQKVADANESLSALADRKLNKLTRSARNRDSMQALSKLGEMVDGRYRIVSQPPIVVPARDWQTNYGLSEEAIGAGVQNLFRSYRATLQDDRRELLERFQVIDYARKVVGVGSVGTRAFIVLLQGRDAHDPLFLQVKEATSSVLEAYLPKSRYRQHGQRVVAGQRIMQAVGDIYLGWTKGIDDSRHYYWRQLRDMKGSFNVEASTAVGLPVYARVCGWTLARAHARSGDPVAIAAYLGSQPDFDRSIADFAKRYAVQNERDYDAFIAAIRAGTLQAVENA